MHDDLNQQISLFLDDELSQNHSISLLQQLRSTPELRGTLQRYETISQVLRSEKPILVGADFLAAVSKEVQAEPSYLLPNAKKQSQAGSRFKRPYKIAALAASAAALFVVIKTSQTPDTETITLSQAKQSEPPQQTAATQTSHTEPYPVNKQINDYLQAHNSSVYTNGQADFQPYARVTQYRQE